MKKIVCLLLAALMLFSMVACGDNTNSENPDDNMMSEAETQAFRESMEALGKLDVETLAKYVRNDAELEPIRKILADETTKNMWLALFGKVQSLGGDNWFAYQNHTTYMFAYWYTDLLLNGKEMPSNTSQLTKDELCAIFDAHVDKLSYTNILFYPDDAIQTEGDKVYVNLQKLCDVLTGYELDVFVPVEGSCAHLEYLLFGISAGEVKANTLESEVYAPFKEIITLDLTKVEDVVARLDYDFEAKVKEDEYKKECATNMSHAAVYQKYYKDAEFVAKLQQFIETADVEILFDNDDVLLKWNGLGAFEKEHVEVLKQINGREYATFALSTAISYGTPDAKIIDFYLYKCLVDAYLMENA